MDRSSRKKDIIDQVTIKIENSKSKFYIKSRDLQGNEGKIQKEKKRSNPSIKFKKSYNLYKNYQQNFNNRRLGQ